MLLAKKRGNYAFPRRKSVAMKLPQRSPVLARTLGDGLETLGFGCYRKAPVRYD